MAGQQAWLWRGLCLVALLCGVAVAAEEGSGDGDAPKKPKSPSLQQIEDVPGLPRVLLIGDSISIGYTLKVRELVGDRANVHRPPTNCGSTMSGVAHIDDWLGDKPWDVIHFNFGLHDLKYLSESRQNVPPDKYEANLLKLIDRLKATGATVIFATTTPVPSELRPSQYPRKPEDVPIYNDIAVRLMTEANCRVNDLYTLILPHVEEYQLPKDVHFKKAGYDFMAEHVTEAIVTALDERAKSAGE